MGARETALNALIACRKSGAWSNTVLKEYIESLGYTMDEVMVLGDRTRRWLRGCATASCKTGTSWIFT